MASIRSTEISKGNPSEGIHTIKKLLLTDGAYSREGMYRTYDLGKPNVYCGNEHRVVMVVGATGSGKSTLINGMINYILKVEWDNDYRLKIIDEKGENTSQGQAQSQTQVLTSYTIYPRKDSAITYILTIIDTPGFGDTRGIKHDQQITKQIKAFFLDAKGHRIDHINAIGFVVQSSLVRLTKTQEYIFESILTIFGKDIEDKIMLLVTFCDGQDPPVLDAIEKSVLTVDTNNALIFNNSALFASKAIMKNEKKKGRVKLNFAKKFWEMGFESMGEFFDVLAKTKATSITQTTKVLEEREQLQSSIQGLQPQIRAGCAKLESLRKEQTILEESEEKIKANKDFEYILPVVKFNNIPIPGEHVTNCKNCNVTCHYPCVIERNEDKRGCAAMKDGLCTVCKDKCKWSDHFNTGHRIEFYTVNERRKYADLEERYRSATGEKLSVKKVIERLKQQFKGVQECVYSLIRQSHQSLHLLKEMALRPIPRSTADYVAVLIEHEKSSSELGSTARIKGLEEILQQSKLLEELAEDASFDPFEQYYKEFQEKQKANKGGLEACILS